MFSHYDWAVVGDGPIAMLWIWYCKKKYPAMRILWVVSDSFGADRFQAKKDIRPLVIRFDDEKHWPIDWDDAGLINRCTVERAGWPGLLTMDSTELHIPRLGRVITYERLYQSMWKKIESLLNDDVDQIHYDDCTIQKARGGWRIHCHDVLFHVDALIWADGRWGEHRSRAGTQIDSLCLSKKVMIPMTSHQYVTIGTVEAPSRQIASECMIDAYQVLALLPLNASQMGWVWTHSQPIREHDHQKAMDRLCQTYRDIPFRACHLYAHVMVQPYVRYVEHSERFFLMGDAAHALHPMTAHGLHEGLADVLSFFSIENRLNSSRDRCQHAIQYHDQLRDRQRRIIAYHRSLNLCTHMSALWHAFGLGVLDLFGGAFAHYMLKKTKTH